MKFECPHCRQRTVGTWAKLSSAPQTPAKCPACGGLSSEGEGMRWAKAVFHGLAPFAAFYGALFLLSWWPLIIYPLAVIGISAFELIAFPLHPVTEAVVAQEQRFRRYALAGFGALLGLALISSLAGG